MAIELPGDFDEFLRSLNDHRVDYLLIDGIAVALHGYPRATQDLDVWIDRRRANADASWRRCERSASTFPS